MGNDVITREQRLQIILERLAGAGLTDEWRQVQRTSPDLIVDFERETGRKLFSPGMRGPRMHVLKSWPGGFQALVDGRKRFEWRRDDGRDFQVGDRLALMEWNTDPLTAGETGRRAVATVSWILRGQFGVPDGHCVMSLADVRAVEEAEWFEIMDGE